VVKSLFVIVNVFSGASSFAVVKEVALLSFSDYLANELCR
jgi:hypothetical protein